MTFRQNQPKKGELPTQNGLLFVYHAASLRLPLNIAFVWILVRDEL